MKCELCKLNEQLEYSHIIPKFLFNYYKKNTSTGFLREVNDPNTRVQDGLKCKFLCESCEDLFSRFEQYFSKFVFYPYVNRKLTKENLHQIDSDKVYYFSLSVLWRSLKYLYINHQISNLTNNEEDILISVLEASEKYLLSNINLSKPIKIYFLPTKLFKATIEEDKFTFYDKNIELDFRIFDDVNWGFIYVKIPHFIIIGDIFPSKKVAISRLCINNKFKYYDPKFSIPEPLMRHINNQLTHFIDSAQSLNSNEYNKIQKSHDKSVT